MPEKYCKNCGAVFESNKCTACEAGSAAPMPDVFILDTSALLTLPLNKLAEFKRTYVIPAPVFEEVNYAKDRNPKDRRAKEAYNWINSHRDKIKMSKDRDLWLLPQEFKVKRDNVDLMITPDAHVLLVGLLFRGKNDNQKAVALVTDDMVREVYYKSMFLDSMSISTFKKILDNDANVPAASAATDNDATPNN